MRNMKEENRNHENTGRTKEEKLEREEEGKR